MMQPVQPGSLSEALIRDPQENRLINGGIDIYGIESPAGAVYLLS